MCEAFGECDKLVESTRPRENEWGGVQYDVVAHAVRIGVRDETVVRPIVVKCRSEVKTNEAEVVPSFATGIVEDDESPAGCNWVGDEVVGLAINSVVGRDRCKVSVGSLKIECQFKLQRATNDVMMINGWLNNGLIVDQHYKIFFVGGTEKLLFCS